MEDKSLKNIFKIFAILLSLIILFILVLFIPLPLTEKQLEFNNALPAGNVPVEKAVIEYNKLIAKYPDNRLFLELNEYLQIPAHDKHKIDFCGNAEILRYDIARAASCSLELEYAMRYDEAIAVITNYVAERNEKIISQAFTTPFERWRAQLKLYIANNIIFRDNMSKADIERTKANTLFHIHYYGLEDYDKALEYALLSGKPENIGYAYLKKKEFDKAQEYFSKMKAEPFKQTLIQAQTAFEKGDYETAKKLFIETNELTKKSSCKVENQPSLEGLAEIAILQNDRATAIKYLKKRVEKSPYNLKLQKKLKDLEGK